MTNRETDWLEQFNQNATCTAGELSAMPTAADILDEIDKFRSTLPRCTDGLSRILMTTGQYRHLESAARQMGYWTNPIEAFNAAFGIVIERFPAETDVLRRLSSLAAAGERGIGFVIEENQSAADSDHQPNEAPE